jgi:anhydro-N-acetylmuramic acid kinase
MKTQLVLGIMSGTSLDGVDYALCRIGTDEVSLILHWSVGFSRDLRKRLDQAARGAAKSHEIAQLHHDLGRFYAAHAEGKRSRFKPNLVGLHGQTIFHNPHSRRPATLQLGEPAYLAETLSVPVICNFRAADMAAGGQGAPLATLFHLRAFASRGQHVCVNNLGGISNVTSIDWRRGQRAKVMAFDTGPANALLDLAVRHFTGERQSLDRNGAWARKGEPSEPLLKHWLRHSYFRQSPPKSTGRELFGERFFAKALGGMDRNLSKFDFLATLTEFSARSLVLNYRLHLPSAPSKVILTGGGAANPLLVQRIEANLRFSVGDKVSVITSDQLGWPLQAIEPAAFALLAWMRARRRPGNLPETTGARRAVLLGQVVEA